MIAPNLATDRFAEFLPTIERDARFAFRGVRPDDLEDVVQNVIALALHSYRLLQERGRENLAYATVLGRYAIWHYRAGRRIGRQSTLRAATNYHYHVDDDGHYGDWFDAIADDNSQVDTVIFKLDFADWLETLCDRDRWVIELLGAGNSTSDIEPLVGLRRNSVNRLRHQLQSDWETFDA